MADQSKIDALRMRVSRIEALSRDLTKAINDEVMRLTTFDAGHAKVFSTPFAGGAPAQTTAIAAVNTAIIGETTEIASLLGSL